LLVLAVAILVLGVILAKNNLPLSSRGSQVGGGGEEAHQESKSNHPRLDAHRLLEQKTPTAVVYEWLPYYYRHPRPHEIVDVIEVLLAQEHDIPGGMGTQKHSLAAILHEHKEALETLKAASQRYAGDKSETVSSIIQEAENYQAVKEISPSNLESLWAEYRATGEKDIITRMIQALEPSQSNPDLQLMEAIRQSFCRYLPRYTEVHEALDEAGENATGVFRDRLEQIKQVVLKTFKESGYMHLVRADNYVKQRQYDRALDEFEQSLGLWPDNPYVFINLANLYEAQGRQLQAIAAMKKALQISPTNETACYGTGRYCFFQHKYDEAIAWYAEALKRQPRRHLYLHALARSYQEKGDTANAVEYFQQYLQYAPTGEHVDLVKQYLASVKVPVEESAPLFAAFKKKDFEGLELQFAAILQERKKDKDGYSCLSKGYDQLCRNPDARYAIEKSLGDYEGWLKYNPSSHFANAAIGMFYLQYAWHARGEGLARTITDEGHRLYKERLVKAREYLEKAYLLDPSDPLVPSSLISVVTGLGSDYTEMEKQFQRAIQADKSEFGAYGAKLTYLMPKWHGTRDMMFAFARQTARNAPPDSLAPRVLAKAHWEMYAWSEDKRSYFKNPEVWNEIKKVYTTLTRQFPESNELHNWFAKTAYLADDLETAKHELTIIREDWSEDAWGSYAGFTRARDEILRR
jgi:tetratricopeptide (TPR) repeat protein